MRQFLATFACLLPACTDSLPPEGVPTLVPSAPHAAVVVRNVRLIPMTTPTSEPGRAVVVENGRITWIGADADVAVPAGALVVDGGDRYLMPGLADMHVHVSGASLPTYVAYGITTVRNMWGFESLREYAPQTLSSLATLDDPSELLSPAIYSASPGIDANTKWPQTQILLDPAAADTLVGRLVDDGWPFIKAYVDLSRASYDSIVAAANRRGVPVVGHVPFNITLSYALAARQRSIEHLSGYDRVAAFGRAGALAWAGADVSQLAGVIDETIAAGTWNCPTLVILKAISDANDSRAGAAQARDNRNTAIGMLYEAGAPLLAGTDAGIGVVPPGSSLADELSEFVAAGLTPYEAILTATRNAAEFLGQETEFGAITVGLRGDLLLLDANPLENIAALRNPRAVMLRGRWHARQ